MIRLIVVNLRRRRARTMLTALGIAIGVATIVALLSLTAGLRRSAAGLVDLGKADVALFQANVGDLTSSALPESLVAQVRRVPGVTAASPAQLVTGAVAGRPDFLLVGLEPDGFVSRRLVVTAGRRARDGEVMLGDAAARRLGLRSGDRLEFGYRSLPIAGIYHSGVSFEDEGGDVSLGLAQRLTGRRGEVTTIAVSLSPTTKASTMSDRLQRAFPGTIAISDPDQLARASTNTLLIDKAVVVIAVLALVIGAISVTNTMVLTVSERQGELGLLAAVGWSPLQIARLILGEGIALSVIGSLIGLALGVGLSALAVQALSASTLVSPQVTAWGLGRGLLVGLAIGILGGLYPAWRVTRLRPVEALARA